MSRARVAGWPPRYLTKTTAADRRRGDGDDVVEFAESYARITKDSIAGPVGELFTVYPWQRELLRFLFARGADGKRLHRRALVGLPRKNGKSSLGAAIALFELFVGPAGGEVYSCAADREQARIVFGTAKRMIELDDELSSMAKLYRDAVEFTETGSVYRVLSAEAYTKEGLNPTAVLFDEVHAQPSRELWDVMSLAMGSRPEPLMLGITTAGARVDRLGNDSLCYGLYQYGKRIASGEVDDPTFAFAWWEPKRGAESDHTDPKVWQEANPGYGTLVAEDDFASAVRSTLEPEFRTKRTNLWVVSASSALPFGSWARIGDGRTVDDLDRQTGPVVLMADGSWNGDSTGIVGCTVVRPEGDDDDELPVEELFVGGLWERPEDAPPEWRIPLADVKARIVELCRTLNVVAVGLDPFRWQQTIADLEEVGLPIEEFPTTSVPRMVKAWATFFDAVLDREVAHDGDAALARHVENMRLKIDAQGARPVKESKASKRHIDLGICAVSALTISRQWSDGQVPDDLSEQVF